METAELCAGVLLSGIANWQAIETLHHGSLFENFRARMEVRTHFFARAFTCPFCFSHWTAVLFTGCLITIRWDLIMEDWRRAFLAPAVWLAIIRLSNIFNDACHGFCRTPRIAPLGDEVQELDEL